MKTFQSTPITFIDQTDSRKLEVYITSNLPTVQIYNQNKAESEAYTPDWTEGDDKLTLSMDVFLDSRAMTIAEYNSTTIKWYKNGTEMSDGSIEDISGDKRKIIIKDNILKDNAIITYTCEATYQGIVASTRITFTRVDTGLNGQKGADGTSVRILGTAKSATLVASTSYHTIVYDTGAIVAAKLGDAYVLKDASSDLDGHLFVCALLNGGQDGVDYFIDAGQIQGPAGDPAKSITLIGSAQVFKVGKDGKTITPKAITVTAHTVNIDDNSGIKWQYKYDTASTWTEITNKIVQDASGKTVISINNNNDVATVNVEYLNSRTSIALKATYENAEDALTLYKVFDGIDGEKGDPGDDAPIAFLSNEHIAFVADANGNVNAQTIYTSVVGYRGTVKEKPSIGSLAVTNAGLEVIGMKVEIDQEATAKLEGEVALKISVSSKVNGKDNNLGSPLSNNGYFSIPVTSPASVALQLNWTKVNAGAEGEPGVGINSVVVDYGTSNSISTKPADDKWYDEVPEVPEGHYLWTRTIIDYTDLNKADTVTYTYAKQGEQGRAGDSVTVSSIQYQEGASATTAPTGNWSDAVVAVADGKYLWTKTTFSDKKVAYGVAKQGNAGRGVSKITENYLASTAVSGVTTATSGWTTTIQTIDASKRYLWNYETITYTDNTTSNTSPVIIGVFGATGNTGKGIASITEYYLATASASGVTTSTTGWTPTIQTISATNKYLWNYELITYTDNTTSTVAPVIIGVYGDKGDSGAPASLVDITPSAMYFKSTTGSTGTFEPQYIYLYPRFQNATYSNWQYSLDGGTTWVAASGANGLTIGTYNSISNSLRIARGSTLYTESITSISFKCNSTTSGVYDTVSIAKIYDVVDLQIGGRNLLPQSKMDKVPTMWNGGSLFTIVTEDGYACSKLSGAIGVTTSPNIDIFNKLNLLDVTQEYTVSAWVKVVDYVGGTTNPFCALYFSGSKVSDNSWIGATNVIESGDMTRFNNQGWKKLVWTLKFDSPISKMNFYVYVRDLTGTIFVRDLKLEYGNTPSDWSPAPEDLIEEAANVNVMLSNEAHFFEATAGGVPIDTSVTLDVVGYKGSVKSATTVGTIVGIPSAGMTATITNNNTTNTKLTIAVTSALTSDIADYGILTIPITVNGHTINKIFNWTKAKAGDVGASGSDAVTFQVYSNNGYALSTSVPTITLQTFAYVGDVEIKAGATYQWYRHNNTDWVAISGATNDYFNVSRDDVTFSNNYQCKMQFGGAEYVGVVTIEDKNDENKVFASKPYNYFAGDLWIVGTDYTPPSYTVGTMLRAEHTNTGYIDSDWVPATKYDDEIKDLRDTVDSYKQYFSVNSTNGLQIGNSSINNDILTTDTVNAANINADLASLESLDIIGKYSGSTMLQAPVINLGKFSIVIESNGSLSIVANT